MSVRAGPTVEAPGYLYRANGLTQSRLSLNHGTVSWAEFMSCRTVLGCEFILSCISEKFELSIFTDQVLNKD